MRCRVMRSPSVSNTSENSRLSGREVGGISPRGPVRRTGVRSGEDAFNGDFVARLDGGFEDKLAVWERPLESCLVAFEGLDALEFSRAGIDRFHVGTEELAFVVEVRCGNVPVMSLDKLEWSGHGDAPPDIVENGAR